MIKPVSATSRILASTKVCHLVDSGRCTVYQTERSTRACVYLLLLPHCSSVPLTSCSAWTVQHPQSPSLCGIPAMHGNLNAEAETGSMPVDIQSTEHSFQTQGVSHHFAEKLNYSLSSLKKIKIFLRESNTSFHTRVISVPHHNIQKLRTSQPLGFCGSHRESSNHTFHTSVCFTTLRKPVLN